MESKNKTFKTAFSHSKLKWANTLIYTAKGNRVLSRARKNSFFPTHDLLILRTIFYYGHLARWITYVGGAQALFGMLVDIRDSAGKKKR